MIEPEAFKRDTEGLKHKSEEHKRLIIESANDYAIFSMDTNRCVTSWSKGAETIFSYSEQEIIGHSGDIIFTPEDRDKGVQETEAETATKKGRAISDRWHVRKDGSRFWASGSISQLRDANGTLLGFVKIMRDLTESKEAEEALGEKEEQFRLLVTAISDSVYKMSADWKLMYSLKGNSFLAATSKANSSWLETYIPQHERDRVSQAIEEAIQNKSIF